MVRVLIPLLFASSLLFGELYKVPDFEADIFSKEGNKLKKIELSIMFDGENVRAADYKLLDALNVVISSFYLEDLFTSKGKERFKKLLRQYILKKYMIDIDFIYILKLDIKERINIDELLERLQHLQKNRSQSGRKSPHDTNLTQVAPL